MPALDFIKKWHYTMSKNRNSDFLRIHHWNTGNGADTGNLKPINRAAYIFAAKLKYQFGIEPL